MGRGYFALCLIVVVAGYVGFSVWRDRRRASHALLIVEHKEKEIERLAEDNRRYREVYLGIIGAPPALLRHDATDAENARAEREQELESKK